jgi:hypothetical protein
VIQQIARDDAEMKSCLQEQGGNTTKFAAENFSASLVDLNRDGKPEWIIKGIPGPCGLCGNHACRGGGIYREVGGRYELLLEMAAFPLSTFTNGYKDLKDGAGTPVWSYETVFKYDGRRYKAVECLTYEATESRNGQIRLGYGNQRWKLTYRGPCRN